MPYLDVFTQPLTAQTAIHLLRRATVGPTQQEVTAFIGRTATQAVQQLINNANYSPTPPVAPNGQPFLDKPYETGNNGLYCQYVTHWWMALMIGQNAPPSLLDKLTLFWQNHFVTTRTVIDDYRFINRYLLLLRNNALGNFRTLVTEITKDPAMLHYLNGTENEKGKPNENYARELQELFTVGAGDATGIKNYTEDDVKAAARVLTGWKRTNQFVNGSTTFGTIFVDSQHDTADKTFSASYNNTTIKGWATAPTGFATAGDAELADLVAMLLKHPQTPRFICRKLYRWYVNPNVTPDIENNVIVPLAAFFSSQGNNYAIRPVLEKLLTSEVFFSNNNIGAIIKSPIEFVLGSLRFFVQPVPDMATDAEAFKNYFQFAYFSMWDMQLIVLDQPSVFGYEPYYQTGYSKNWINSTTAAVRNNFVNILTGSYFEIKPGYKIGIDLLGWASSLQTNFSDVDGTPAITCEQVLASFSTNLFSTNLFENQKNFLIDTIMMQAVPRSSWAFEWNAYRRSPTDANKKAAVAGRLQNLMKFMLRMAEYTVF